MWEGCGRCAIAAAGDLAVLGDEEGTHLVGDGGALGVAHGAGLDEEGALGGGIPVPDGGVWFPRGISSVKAQAKGGRSAATALNIRALTVTGG